MACTLGRCSLFCVHYHRIHQMARCYVYIQLRHAFNLASRRVGLVEKKIAPTKFKPSHPSRQATRAQHISKVWASITLNDLPSPRFAVLPVVVCLCGGTVTS